MPTKNSLNGNKAPRNQKSSSSNRQPITKEERKELRKRMRELQKRNMDNRSSTQSVIPYINMFKDGTCQIDKTHYSQTIEFYDCNYRLASWDDKNSAFTGWCNLHNYFDDSLRFQFTYENQNTDRRSLLNDFQIPEKNDKFNDVRKEYSDMLCKRLTESTGGKSIKKYLTFTTEATSVKAARIKLNAVSDEIIKLFSDFRVLATKLNGRERLESLYRSLNPFDTDPFIFDWSGIKHGLTTKDFIAPSSMSFSKQNFEINNSYGSVVTINLLAGEMSDKIISEFFERDESTDRNNMVSMNISAEPYDQAKALKLIRSKLTDVEKMKIDEQKKASMSGYDPDILPPQIKTYIQELDELLEDLNGKNERLFKVGITIRCYAKSKKELKLQLEKFKRISQKNNCKMMFLDYQQEAAFASSLPIGIDEIQVFRELPTSAMAVFVPFETQEIFMPKGCYYGLNAVTNNMIMGDRTKLKNPNGLYLGVPGAGKSFAIKREILDIYLRLLDYIIITDPEGEYAPLVEHLGGQIVKISSSSSHYINPMDISLDDNDEDDNRISTKSDFLISLCEIIVGGKYGLAAEERSIIDLATRNVYNRFFADNPSVETMPTLGDLLTELRKPELAEVSMRVANSLEMYVNGSQNLFNHRTNVDVNNRLLCYDIKNLGSQLKKVAQLIIQDQVWNRVSQNRDEDIKTRYYIDEFHLLLRDEQTAKYSVEIWKRFRKWGGIPTGITQNVKDLLASPEIENILDNSDFIYMLSQASGDREILADKLHISDAQIEYVKNVPAGNGLIIFGRAILPFKDEFPENTLTFQLLNTDPDKKKAKKKSDNAE